MQELGDVCSKELRQPFVGSGHLDAEELKDNLHLILPTPRTTSHFSPPLPLSAG